MAKLKPGGTSRRSFLKASGLTAVSSLLVDARAQTTQEPVATNSAHGAVDWVNIFQGTNSSRDFSRGNTLPIAALPFGMAHWTLQTHADTPWMFQPGVRRIQGVRLTHQLSPWLGDYGYATFLPIRGEVEPGPEARSSSYAREKMKAAPHCLDLFLLRYRAQMELVPTERGAVLTAVFDAHEVGGAPGLLIDVPQGGGAIEADPATRTIRFRSTANAGGVPANFATYYVLQLHARWTSFVVRQAGEHQVATLHFSDGDHVEARIASSFISFAQAERNLEGELGAKTALQLRNAAEETWNDHLGRIQIETASVEQRRKFYSCMYRALLFPRVWHEPDGQGGQHHFSAFNGRVMPGRMYADHGYWDVYRAWYPMMTILFPARLGEILDAWLNAYKEGGWLPQFPCPGYRACMTGSLIDSVFGDAAAKGLAGFDLPTAFEALKKHATMPGDPAKGYGRTGLELYLALHYVPADKVAQSVAETADAAYGDFCIAQVAKALGRTADYAHFLERSQNWRKVYDPDLKFFRGKNSDGSWIAFEPFTWGSPYVEGGAWQHRWDAPQDVAGMIALAGGSAAAVTALEQMLAMEPIFQVGVYGQEIHEMSEMAAVPFGQYAHSNQPVHHLLYLFAHAGRPELTQKWVRKIMNDLYSAETFAGDEDTGSMSAWFVLSALGFYPVCPGKPEYTLGSPLFARAVVDLGGGKTLVVKADKNADDVFLVRKARFEGKPVTSPTLSHSDLMKGGTLEFEMSS